MGVNVVEPGLTDDLLGTDEDDIFVATSEGIVMASIDALGGDDEITGNSAGDAIDDSTIDGGSGDDVITGNATLSGAEIAISNSNIDGGSGDDVITGIGENVGISNSTIHGGSGNDIFDLQSGTGTVMGGRDEDLLILEGLKSDYTFTPIEELDLGVNITRASTSTDLAVSEVELFQFKDDPGTILGLSRDPCEKVKEI